MLSAFREPRLLQDISNFLDELDDIAEDDLRLAVSKKSVMTLAPPQTEAGDVVCLLRAATCPIILRPQGDSYVFIGLADHYPYCYDECRMNVVKFPDSGWQRLHII